MDMAVEGKFRRACFKCPPQGPVPHEQQIRLDAGVAKVRRSREEIRHALDGNICRCTGYQNIVAAIREAARTMREGAAAPTGASTAPAAPMGAPAAAQP